MHFGLEKPNLTEMGPLVEEREYGCFKSGRDVVLAPYFRPKASVVRVGGWLGGWVTVGRSQPRDPEEGPK